MDHSKNVYVPPSENLKQKLKNIDKIVVSKKKQDRCLEKEAGRRFVLDEFLFKLDV